jgi:hypothetical protein
LDRWGGKKETYGNGIGRVDDKVTQGKSESGAGTLDRDAARTAHIAPISFYFNQKKNVGIHYENKNNQNNRTNLNWELHPSVDVGSAPAC